MNQRVFNEHSAGGVVVRPQGDSFEVLLVATRGGKRWQLPKGRLETGETPEQTAQREVAEEGGVVARVLEPVGTITYWYTREGRRVHKRVDFFLMEYLRGDPSQHGWEVDDARFLPASQAVEMVSFANERDIVRRALSRYQALRSSANTEDLKDRGVGPFRANPS